MALLLFGFVCGLPIRRAAAAAPVEPHQTSDALHLIARGRAAIIPRTGRFEVTERTIDWNPRETALIICDLWDKHWCDGADQRVAAMAPRVNALARALRDRGGLIVHAPSDTMRFYEGTAQRQCAREAPAAPTAENFQWNYCDPTVEPPLPIDDSDGGSDTPNTPPKGPPYPWTREHPAVEVAPQDAVSDQGREIFNLFFQHHIRNVLYCGVHANMCVLGRSFGIREFHRLHFNVMLVRDLTDALYNPAMYPYVPHDRGTDLVVEHIERYWCPSCLSGDILGDRKPLKIVFAIGEDEYHAKETLPQFIKTQLTEYQSGPAADFKCVVLQGDDKSDLPGLDALNDTDVLVMFMRRRTLPPAQMSAFRAYFDSGRPVAAIRTSCHAFQNWLAFDGQVLGCHYDNHYPARGAMAVSAAASAIGNPLLRGVSRQWETPSSLYKVLPLADDCLPLLNGKWSDKPVEPIAWTRTHHGGKVFFTSLGSPDDFRNPDFCRLLRNAILWAADKPIPSIK